MKKEESKFRKLTCIRHCVQKYKYSDTQVFLQQIIKGVITGVLFDTISYCFHTYHKELSLYVFPSTASVCITAVIN